MTSTNTMPPAGVMRRFGALFYDALIVIAIEMLAAGVIVALLHALMALGIFNHSGYADVSDFLTNHPIWSPAYTFYLVVVWVYFFVFFWTRAGQTLGMRAWKLRVQNKDGSAITVTQALIRLGTSGFGLANLCVPFDPEKRGFHDIWAKTEVVVLPQAR